MYEWNYKNGEKHGLCKWYYENGAIMYEYNCKNGMKDGLCKRWYESGEWRYITTLYSEGSKLITSKWRSVKDSKNPVYQVKPNLREQDGVKFIKDGIVYYKKNMNNGITCEWTY
jgi:antitoxin component YwqK of YwqJK toxin-antitoxin module